jgi:hypothetical protein
LELASAQWGTDYLNRTGTAKSNMYDNRPQETKYIYTNDDSQGNQLNGQNTYEITFAKDQVPQSRASGHSPSTTRSIFSMRIRWVAIHWAPRTRTSNSMQTVP